MDETLILRFSKDHPCWTKDLLERAGEESAGLEELERRGLLLRQGDIYGLSAEGRRVFAGLSAELFLYEEPGVFPDAPAGPLMATELWLELERCNLQRGGVKRYLFRPEIPVRPALGRDEVWSVAGEKVLWSYTRHPAVEELTAARPLPGPRERRPEVPDIQALQRWRELRAEAFTPEAACLVYYDFEHYLDFKGHPGDGMKLINADRFFFSAAPDAASQLDEVGRFQRWLLELRRLQIPGYLDLDTQEQGSVNWLIFLTKGQRTAEEIQACLKRFGSSLIEPADPMEVWTLSLEALRRCPSRREVIWDVLPEAGLPICLTL